MTTSSKTLTAATQVAIATLLFSMLGWLAGYSDHGGFGFSGKKLFNWHPLFMTFGYGVCVAEGVISWAWLPVSHSNAKKIHGALHGSGVVAAIMAALAVLVYHHEQGYPHFKSVHSWVGLVALLCLFFQLIASSIIFGLDFAGPATRQRFLSLHRPVGTFIYGCGVVAIATGLMRLQSFLPEAGAAAAFANWIAIVLLVNALLIFAHLSRAPLKRDGTPQEIASLNE